MRKTPSIHREKQIVSEDLVGGCLAFIQRKFYRENSEAFAKDRQRILAWVVLYPAKWLDERGVTLKPERYKEIFESVFMDSLRFGDTGNIGYAPAWLGKVIQSHFDHHGDEIYEEAKSLRTRVELALQRAGTMPERPAPDPVREMARAARLLKPKKKAAKVAPVAQLDLL